MKLFLSVTRYFVFALIPVILAWFYISHNILVKSPSNTSIPTNKTSFPTALTPFPITSRSLPPPGLESPNINKDSYVRLSSDEPTHFSYQANNRYLVQIGTFYDRQEYLDQEAAQAFKKMCLSAQYDGVDIIPVSGFRSFTDQQKLFERQIKRMGSPKSAAKLSAPPGFSEHHTGYAIDLADNKSPETVLKFDFDKTQAFHWLKNHAAEYKFELSFPKNNSQGVSYEPWHWRFVGSAHAKQVFSSARQIP